MLDRLEAFARGKQDVGGRHVVLEIDELLRPARRGLAAADEPQRLQCTFDGFRDLRRDRALLGREARGLRRFHARIDREPQRARQAEFPGRRAVLASACTGLPGRKHAFSSLQHALPPDCANRCSTGLKPPDIATRSHGSVCSLPPTWPFVLDATSTDDTRHLPDAAVTTAPLNTVTPCRFAAAGSAPFDDARESTTVTFAPHAFRSSAVWYA